MIIRFDKKEPQIAGSAFITANASIIGDVVIGEETSVWFGAVIRGDENKIRIGNKTNIQDLCVVHVQKNHETIIGDNVTIGHRAIVHCCRIGNRCLIGMGSIIMNGVVIGEDCIVGAGALVTEGVIIPPRSLVIGFPAKPKRELTKGEMESIVKASENYVGYASSYFATSSS